jgi:MoaA/NifB/PqqE/SkfB family radical SAM enzyme
MSAEGNPEGVEINPGMLCNNKCVFCMSGYERDEHPPWAEPGRFRAELLRYRNKGVRALGILGGEPTAYPHLLDSLAYAKSLGYERIAICTNGMRLANMEYARRLVDAGATRFTVSVHSHRAEVEEALVQVPGILAKKWNAVRNLVQLRDEGRLPDNVSLNPVLCRLNMGDMEAYLRFYKSFGVDDIRFNFIWPQARVRGDRKIVPTYREAMPFMLSAILRNEKEIGARLSFGGVPFCALPKAFHRRSDWVRRYFDESALDLRRESSIHRSTPREFETLDWFEEKIGDFKLKTASCDSCRYRDSCQGVWKSYVEMYGDEEIRPIPADDTRIS